jgi:hypothetical protein
VLWWKAISGVWGDLAWILRSDDGRPLQRREGIILKVFGREGVMGAVGEQ